MRKTCKGLPLWAPLIAMLASHQQRGAHRATPVQLHGEEVMFRPQKQRGFAGVLFAVVVAFALPGASQTKPSAAGVQLVVNEAARRVDVLIDGRQFTSYIWPDSVK